MTAINSKFDEGQLVYFIIYSSLQIVPAIVKTVHFKSMLSKEDISYTLDTNWFDSPKQLQYVGESSVYTFLEAKNILLAWLDAQKTRISNLTDPAA